MGETSGYYGRALGVCLREGRRALGWSLKELFEQTRRMGAPVSISALSRVENGQATLSIEQASVVARALGLRLAHIEERVLAETVSVDGGGSGRTVEELLERGREQRMRGRHHEALCALEAAHDLLMWETGHAPGAEDHARLLIELCDIYRRTRRFELCREVGRKMLNLEGLSEFYYLHAVIARIHTDNMADDFANAEIYGAFVLPKLTSAHPFIQASGTVGIGNTFARRKRYAQAVPFLETGCRLFKRTSVHNWCHASMTLGHALVKTGDAAAGQDLLERALDYARTHRLGDSFVYGLTQRGRLHVDAGRYDAARRDFESAAAIARQARNDRDVFNSWNEVRKLALRLGDVKEAERLRRVLGRIIKRIDDGSVDTRGLQRYLQEGIAS